MDDLTDSLLTEQFLMTLSSELRQHVYAREPTCAEDSAKFADVYFTLRVSVTSQLTAT